MPVSLNKEQAAVLRAVKAGKNVFLTGAGGTGKSHTIRAITEWATAAGIRHAVTAMTGCAALLLNPAVTAAAGPSLRTAHAKTLHSWAGVGLAREAPHELAAAVIKNKRAAARWLDTQLLVIDEISMMTPDFLEKLDLVARRVRRRPAVRFGGLQLILAGDFCQLPPVQRSVPTVAMGGAGASVSGSSSSDDDAKGAAAAAAPKFVFEMPLWAELIDESHELVQIQRQSDPVFQQLLNEARFGELSAASVDLLTRRMGLPWQENEIRPTLIFSRNAEVNSINEQNMALLDGERHVFKVQTTYKDGHATSHPDALETALTRFDADAPYDTELTLCVGAQVMLLINKDQEAGLVNGSRGVVTAFSDGGLPIVQFKSGPVLVDRTDWWLPDPDFNGIGRAQIPLRVAYAITIHKSQGATLDTALVDIGSRTFEFGQAYVALSRVRSLDGLYIWKLDPRKVRCHPAVRAFYERLRSAAGGAGDPATSASAAGPSEDPEVPEPWSLDGVSSAWRAVIDPYLASTAGSSLRETLIARNQTTQTAPHADDVFAALRACPDPAKVRVVILGQDPYHTPGLAHGLAFSVRPAVTKLPPSLQNIYKELAADLGCAAPTSGCLTAWAEQGVLLLNDVLTVAIGSPQSHAGIGWELLTAQILTRVLEVAPHVVVIAWGRPAQKKLLNPAVAARLATKGHTVLMAAHPSPLSAHTGFFGSRPFSKANTALTTHGLEPIKWA
jgi:ATP-dependent DNA helicase PIF1